MPHKYKVATAAILATALIGAGVYVGLSSNDQPPVSGQVQRISRQSRYRDPKTNITMNYPEQMSAQELSEEDRQSNVILRLVTPQGKPPVLITLRYELGLKSITSLTKSTAIDMIMSNSEKALPQRFKGFQKQSTRRYDLQGRPAGEIIFTYNSPVAGQRMKQRFTVVAKDDDTALYLAMQCKEKDFEVINKDYFDDTVSTLSW